jgi:hypothetical protein
MTEWYGRINAISFLCDKSMSGKFASSSSRTVGADGKLHEIDFRGHDRATVAHDRILQRII